MIGLAIKTWAIANFNAAVALPGTYPELAGLSASSMNPEMPTEPGVYIGVAGDEKGDLRDHDDIQLRIRVCAAESVSEHAEARCYKVMANVIAAFDRQPGEALRDFPSTPSGFRLKVCSWQATTTPEPDGEGGKFYTALATFKVNGRLT